MTENALSWLRALDWSAEQACQLSPALRDWLLEERSMTRRFERHCRQVTVRITREGFISRQQATPEVALLPQEMRYWLREIVLYGDGVPWLAGQTLLPESTLTGRDRQLLELGTMPLGRYLFSSPDLTRDFIDVGSSGELWGRRSRLRLAGKPLLLTELFLPDSPLYGETLPAGEKSANE